MRSLIRSLALPLAVALAFYPAASAPQVQKVVGIQADTGEGPELGRAGPHPVGTSVAEIALKPRQQLTAAGVKEAPRAVGVRFWYPATGGGGGAAYRHRMTMPDGAALEIVETGSATENASAAQGRFPLVLISHGLGGWSEHLSRLGEHLASRGYVVAAIDHRDMAFNTVPAFLLSFGNVLSDRARDQREVVSALVDTKSAIGPMTVVDRRRIGLIGYSMGGYGALATAGASYDPDGAAFAQLPEAMRAGIAKPDKATAERIKALVLIAPWGGQPSSRAWSAESLAAVRAPALLVSGDQDDIVDYRQGVRWLFDGLKGADRRLLVYREARHNIAGNAVDPGPNASAEVIGYALEPVWRLGRVNRINQHFITAFLDATLKGDVAKARYLDVPTPVASDGEWPQAFGELNRGAFAGDDQPRYWRGFQRRWATGLELHHKAVGQ